MLLPYASQSNAVKFWAVLSSLALGIVTVAAGASLLFAEKLTASYDVELSGTFQVVSTLGLGMIALVWAVYMLVLALIMGYRRTQAGDAIVVLVFLLAMLYQGTVFVHSFFPWLRCRMTLM